MVSMEISGKKSKGLRGLPLDLKAVWQGPEPEHKELVAVEGRWGWGSSAQEWLFAQGRYSKAPWLLLVPGSVRPR